MIQLDAGSLGRFDVDLTAALAQVGAKADLFVKGFTQTLFNEIQSGGRYSPGTPIDTGFARANWVGGIGAPGVAPLESSPRNPGDDYRADAAAARAQVDATALRAQPGDTVYLSNSAPYIRRLEFGWSRQAPRGMIRLALQNAQAIADEVAAFVAGSR